MREQAKIEKRQKSGIKSMLFEVAMKKCIKQEKEAGKLPASIIIIIN
jgi:hypothetical protein